MNKKSIQEPILMDGGLSVDDRGEVGFVNGFDMHLVRRFYTVTNHKAGFIRAWHAHKKEGNIIYDLEVESSLGYQPLTLNIYRHSFFIMTPVSY